MTEAVPADAWTAYKKVVVERKGASVEGLSKLVIDATQDDLERFSDRYPWADVRSSDDFDGVEWFYIVTDVMADPLQLISEVVATSDDAWRDAVMQFKVGRF
jgi:hypothetical protein